MQAYYYAEIENSKLIDVLEKAQQLGFIGSGDIQTHIKSSILFYRCLEQVAEVSGGLSIIDIGSGGGLPGLIFAVLQKSYISSRITLIESSKRRADFLLDAIGILKLTKSVDVFQGSTLSYKTHRPKEFHSIGTARLFGSLPVTLECLAPLLKINSVITISAHGQDIIVKDDSYYQGCEALGIQLVEKKAIEDHWFWIFEKNGPTKAGYPRVNNLPKQSPLFAVVRE